MTISEASSRPLVEAPIYRRKACRLCGGSRLDPVLQLRPTPLEDDYRKADRLAPQKTYPLDLACCADCGHVHLLDVVDAGKIYSEYLYVTQTSLGLGEHYDRYAAAVIGKLGLSAGAFMVEFGSNDGTMLRAFKKRGLTVLGVDPAAPIAKAATENGTETVADFFTAGLALRIKAERGPAALIAANMVFANIDNLDDIAAALNELLAVDGVFVCETGYLLDNIQNLVFDNIYHEHLAYHSVKPLASFFARHGLEIFAVEAVDSKGGSLRFFVQRRGAGRPVEASVAEFVAREDATGIHTAAPYAALAARLDRTRAELHGLLGGFKRQGKRVAGFGASHSVTTLVHHFELAPYLEFIVDDNPRKQDTFLPGLHIPVLHPRELLERTADYAVILPWRFSRPIRERHADFARAGGRFVDVLPTVEAL